MEKKEYDVAFSYAGEQGPSVEATYRALTKHGIAVFYDKEDIAAVWGKDLYEYLIDVYSKRSRYCVLFLSKNYAAKAWTSHELKAAQARAFSESREYILPARFDDIEIPGLLPTIAYVDLRDKTPEQFAELIARKVSGMERSPSEQAPAIEPALESSLADAVIWAEEYLAPQPLDLSDSIAQAVRNSFREAALEPKRQNLLPYISSRRAQDRVVGYIAFQVTPQQGMVLDLIVALRAEHAYAEEKLQTRPLWQLLVCFSALLNRSDTVASDKELIRKALADSLRFLEKNTQLDPGGQCKHRIRQLLKR